ncbi:MAG: ethanolamine ammonia-lyase reactivating factor EutA [Chloroflexi bacterium]|nr:ethanolamine ammonia-lyase reactivating factor EutA [Chloroflexota bacterium]
MSGRILRGALFHEGHDHDHEDFLHDFHDGDGGPPDDDSVDVTWALDNVELTTVGVDVGSSTSHLLFAKLHLQRLTQSLSSRFVVVHREVLHRSPILLTPYRPDGLIDVDALERFVQAAYAEAGLTPEQIDTGAVILTGAALERSNSRAVAELFARAGGKFVCASAGHNMEGILAAHGSGAVALSHQRGDTLLHVDVGGGTTKLGLLRNGEVLRTAAIHVGGRLVAFDADQRITRIEPSATLVGDQLGITLALGGRISADDRRRLADALVEILLDYLNGREPSALGKQFLLTEPLELDGHQPAGLTFSGGVAEYIYGREVARFGDMGPDLAESLHRAAQQGRLPAAAVALGEGIRATVLGASQFSVQLSGNTVHISDPAVLPLRNLPVVYARLESASPDANAVAQAIRAGFVRLDLIEGEHPAAVALPWRGEPHYENLRALADGIAQAMPRALAAGFPLVITLDGDIGASLGGILHEELDVESPLISIDGLQLVELDYVDIGEIIQPANVVPVVVKSLAFSSTGATVARPQKSGVSS